MYASSCTEDLKPRIASIEVPQFPAFFSGAGDLLSALVTVRFREAASEAGILSMKSWKSADEVSDPTELPLAKALLKAAKSLHGVLQETIKHITVSEEEVQTEKEERERHRRERSESKSSETKPALKDDEETEEQKEVVEETRKEEADEEEKKPRRPSLEDKSANSTESSDSDGTAQDFYHLHHLRTAQSELALFECLDVLRDPELSGTNFELKAEGTTQEEEEMPLRPKGDEDKHESVEIEEREEEVKEEEKGDVIANDEDDRREHEKQID
jgi:hypothetical protein